jgi:prophage regulatory protein
MSDAIRVLRRKQVENLTGLSRSSIYLQIAAGQFPRSIPLGARSVGWVEAEVVEWLQSKVAARTMPATGTNAAHNTSMTKLSKQAAA